MNTTIIPTLITQPNISFPVADLGKLDGMLNNTNTSGAFPSSTMVVAGLSILFFTIGLAGIIGNGLVVFVILRDRKMRQSCTNLIILNLALADLIIMLFGVPEIVQFMMNKGWLLGIVLCKLNRFILVICLYCSVLSLLAVCIERYVAIVHPIRAHIVCTKRKIILTICVIWPIAIFCGLPTLVFNDLVPVGHPALDIHLCRIVFPERAHELVFKFSVFTVYYLFPVLLQITLYTSIGHRLYISTKELNTKFLMRSEKSCKTDKTCETIKARKGVVKMLAASVVVYTLCYLPNQVVLFYETFSSEPPNVTWSYLVLVIVLANINSAANPVLYSIFSQNYRQNFKRCFCFLCILIASRNEYMRPRLDSFESHRTSHRTTSSGTTMSKL